MISYDGLIGKLNEKGLTKTALANELGISSRTVAKIGHGEKIADRVLDKIAAFWTVNRRNYAEISLTTHCCKRCVMKRASVCQVVCTMNFKSV